MANRRTLLRTALVLIGLTALAACGAKPATLSDIPAFPDAVELKPGESKLADTLANNNQTDAALRGQLGAGGKVEQKGYSLPKDTTWDQVKGFYDQKLKASGWGTNSMVSGIMDQANQGNDLFHTANWQKDKQNVTVIMVTSPTDPAVRELIISLASQ